MLNVKLPIISKGKETVEFDNNKSATHFTPQKGEVSYCKKIKKEDGAIVVGDNIQTVYQKYLAFKEWPSLYFIYNQDTYQITELSQLSSKDSTELMEVLSQLNNPLFFEGSLKLICCRLPSSGKPKRLFFMKNKYFLEINTIKKKGKKTLTSSDFINGCGFKFPVSLF